MYLNYLDYPNKIIITMPRKDKDPTQHTYEWATKMVKIARELGYQVVTIEKDDVNYDYVTKMIQLHHPRLFIHVGHGCTTSLQGQWECIVTKKFSIDELVEIGKRDISKLDRILNPVKLGGCGKSMCKLENDICNPICLKDTNINLLKGTIIYGVACHSASQLGKCSIRYGIESYIGYDDLLLFPVDDMRSQDMFGEVHIEFLRCLLEGYSVSEANKEANKMESNYIRIYKKTKYISLPLVWNKMHREILGNKDARIFDT